jgi:hypothetical protein
MPSAQITNKWRKNGEKEAARVNIDRRAVLL